MNRLESSKNATNLDSIKWALIAVLTITAIGLYYFFLKENMWIKIGVWAGWALLCALIASRTKSGVKFVSFARDSKNELQKVVWPTRQETVQTTIVVVVMVLLSSLLLWGLDALLLWIVGMLTGQRG